VDPAAVIVQAIESMLERRSASDVEITPSSDLFADLELDSLEVAELSATLEETLGRDPYSAGEVPRTVGEIVAFYSATPA
jgi:acyl carrier protein